MQNEDVCDNEAKSVGLGRQAATRRWSATSRHNVTVTWPPRMRSVCATSKHRRCEVRPPTRRPLRRRHRQRPTSHDQRAPCSGEDRARQDDEHCIDDGTRRVPRAKRATRCTESRQRRSNSLHDWSVVRPMAATA